MIVCLVFGSVYDAAISFIPGLGDRDGRADDEAPTGYSAVPKDSEDEAERAAKISSQGVSAVAGPGDASSADSGVVRAGELCTDKEEFRYEEADYVKSWVGPVGFGILTVCPPALHT